MTLTVASAFAHYLRMYPGVKLSRSIVFLCPTAEESGQPDLLHCCIDNSFSLLLLLKSNRNVSIESRNIYCIISVTCHRSDRVRLLRQESAIVSSDVQYRGQHRIRC